MLPTTWKARAKTSQATYCGPSYRWVEAYEGFREACTLDPKNHIASSGQRDFFCTPAICDLGPPAALESLAKKYVDSAKQAYLDPDEYPESLRR